MTCAVKTVDQSNTTNGIIQTSSWYRLLKK